MTYKEKLEWVISDVEKSTNFEILAEMKAAMNSVYGSDKNQIIKPTVERILNSWGSRITSYINVIDSLNNEELKIRFESFLYYQAVIHFPEITIKNDYESHKITNIYVRFDIRENGTIKQGLWGVRSSLTEKEYKARYIHSHLHTLDPKSIGFRAFCTGSGEINQVMALLSNKYTSSNFMIFLMHIKNFLEWESSEGTPYIHMSQINRGRIISRGVNTLDFNVCKKIAAELIDSIIEEAGVEMIMKMLFFTVTQNKITVQASAEMEKYLASKILATGPSMENLIVTKDQNGVYHSLSDQSVIDPPQGGVVLEFKGKEIKFQITDKSEEKVYEKFANPKITEEVCKELSHLLTKTALTTPGIRSGSTFNNITRTPSPSDIPVQQSLDQRVVGNALL